MPHLNDPPRVSAPLLTRKNVCRDEFAKDAEAHFRRCVTDRDFAAWAKDWGEALIVYRQRRGEFQ